jgi:hypothetical protein
VSESFLQQILKTGLQDTQTLLSAAVGDLNKTTQTLNPAVKPLTTRYTNLASEV